MSITTLGQMAAAGKRSRKFRHVYGDRQRADKWFRDIKRPLTTGQSNYVSANDKFIAVSKVAAGGPVYILVLDKPHQIPSNQPLLCVHKGKTLDHDFHPFITNMIATVSEDCTVAITTFPIDGLRNNITNADIVMIGHSKKINQCKFNPCSNSILATSSFDKTIKIWNIELAQNIMTFKDTKCQIWSMEWNVDGSQLAMTGKDKHIRIFDPRQLNEATSQFAFGAAKASNVFWVNNMGWIGSFGFSKTAKRQLKMWDLKNLSKPIYSKDIDQSASIIVPYYDNELGLLYSFGKGDGTLSWYELINDARICYHLGMYRSVNPQKGGCFIPKRACDVWKCEINRFLKLTRDAIEPISIIVPRKRGGDVFQDDIFPDVEAGKPVLNSFEWSNNKNCNPKTITMDPALLDINKNETNKIAAKYFIFDEINKLIYGYIKSIKDVSIVDNVLDLIIAYYSVFRPFVQ